ncbi:hypothetical protein STFE110948_02850 [Streptobacillus felis]|uniref:hypothetical protein n=1 Tax=Streptobacillus felis TaxID=1384509 RepID=UPI00082D3CD3|nr:hypothetical protein [Streptobacillus felis]
MEDIFKTMNKLRYHNGIVEYFEKGKVKKIKFKELYEDYKSYFENTEVNTVALPYDLFMYFFLDIMECMEYVDNMDSEDSKICGVLGMEQIRKKYGDIHLRGTVFLINGCKKVFINSKEVFTRS